MYVTIETLLLDACFSATWEEVSIEYAVGEGWDPFDDDRAYMAEFVVDGAGYQGMRNGGSLYVVCLDTLKMYFWETA